MEPQRFTIMGNKYRLEPLSWQQNKWLADHVFQDIDLARLDYATIWDLFRAKGPTIMAISLIPIGKTRGQHSMQSFDEIVGQATYFAVECTGAEVAEFAPHFFQSCRPEQLAMLMPGKTLQAQALEAARRHDAAKPSAAPGETMSTAASSPSVAATSPESPTSSPDGVQPIASPISGDASSGSVSTAPSLAGSA